jgi:hypothetical protein
VYPDSRARAFWPRSVAIAIVRFLLSVRSVARRSIDGLQTVALLCVSEIPTKLCLAFASARLSSADELPPVVLGRRGAAIGASINERME